MTKDPKLAGPDSIVTPKISCVLSAAGCSYHYRDFMYGKDPEVTLNMKDNVHAKYYDN